MEILAYGY